MNKEDERLVMEIKSIVAQGNNAEVKGTKDGKLSVYEVRKKKRVG